jgi:hypothetical protein
MKCVVVRVAAHSQRLIATLAGSVLMKRVMAQGFV